MKVRSSYEQQNRKKLDKLFANSDKYIYMYGLKSYSKKRLSTAYFHSYNCETVEQLVKWFYAHHSYLVELTLIYDKGEQKFYEGRRNEMEGYNGEENISFFIKGTDILVYNCDDLYKKQESSIMNPTPIQKNSTSGWILNDGRFFECEYYGHWHLANRLIETKTFVQTLEFFSDDPELILEKHGCIKVSNKAFHFRKKLSEECLRGVKKYINIVDEPFYFSIDNVSLTKGELFEKISTYFD